MASFVNPFAIDDGLSGTSSPTPDRAPSAGSPRGPPAEFAFRADSALGPLEPPKPSTLKANPHEEKKVLLNMIMQHLETEGFHTAAGVVRNDYVSQFGAVSTAAGAAAKQTNLMKVVAGRLPAPVDNPPRMRSVSGGSAIVPPILGMAGSAGDSGTNTTLPSLPQTAASTDGTISLGEGISLMDALTGAGGVAAAFGSAPAGGRRLRADTGGEGDLDVTIPAPPANPNVKWDTTTGQAARTRLSSGANADVHVIRSAPLSASVAQAAYMVVTSDQARRGGRTSSGIEIIVGLDGEDLLFGDLLLLTVPRTLRKAGRKGQTPWDVFLEAVGVHLSQLISARESSGGILVLGLLQFFLERHALRIGHAALPAALQACRDIATTVHRNMPLWETEHQDFQTATVRGLREIASLLRDVAAQSASRSAFVALDNYCAPGMLPSAGFSSLAVAAAHSPWHRVPRDRGSWIKVPPASMAAAWTLVDHALFCSIPTEDWLGGGWDDSRWQHSADSILRFVDRYQSIAFWAASQVVWAARGGRGVAAHISEQGGPSDRAAMVVRLVTLAQALHKLRNFSTVAALLTGLRMKGLPQLLHATWALVPSSTSGVIASLSSIVSDDQQYKLYHVASNSIEAQQAIVPHLAPHTSALTLLAGTHVPDRLDRSGGDFDEGPPSDARGPPSLHFHKWRNVWQTVLGRLVDWQARRYTPEEMQGGAAVVMPLCLLLGDELRRCRFQFDDDREEAVTELVHLAEALEPPLPPPPPPVQYDEDGYAIEEGVDDGEYYDEQYDDQQGTSGAAGDDSDEEVPWYSSHFTVVE